MGNVQFWNPKDLMKTLESQEDWIPSQDTCLKMPHQITREEALLAENGDYVIPNILWWMEDSVYPLVLNMDLVSL